MKIYQVGGAVRDELLGLTPKDRDFVVVDSSVEEMLALGYEQVGKDFPVFLHPQTKAEYALARREKKTGVGYQGFSFETTSVTLEEDLFRRDLTINAMAKDDSGKLIDPFGGQQDLQAKVLRHVSAHFAEDPLRVLRVARFKARYPEFSITPDTKNLMTKLVASEIKYLSPERFGREFEKGFSEKSPFLFLKTLEEVGFFEHYLPEIKVSDNLKVLDHEGTLLAKLMVMVLAQAKIDSAFKAVRVKLGFNDHTFKELYGLYPSLKKEFFTSTEVVSVMLKTRAHQRAELYALVKEVLALRGDSVRLWEEVRKVSKVYQASDFSFVEALPPQQRTQAVKEALLQKYLAGSD